jgi:hypothetical protein
VLRPESVDGEINSAANDEPLMNAGKPLATGRARELVDILSELEPSDEDDVGPAVTQE